MTSSVFPTDFTANSFPNRQRSQFFRMDGFTYNNKTPNLLRYDDVGNINYGATGRHIAEKFGANKVLSLEELLRAGGIVQDWTDHRWLTLLADGVKMVFLEGAMFQLQFNGVKLENDSAKKAFEYLKSINSDLRRIGEKERNVFGDDPRDSFATTWGYEHKW